MGIKLGVSENLKLTKTMSKLAFKLANTMDLHDYPELLKVFC